MLDGMYCDECGCTGKKIHRRYREHGYCGSCYAREFIRRQCPNCFNLARLPKDIPDSICRSCEAKKPCVRCLVSGKPVGKYTEYGVVCASCAPYFRPKAPCELCGRLSNRLTKVKRFGDDLRRCERCAISDHGVCQACRRYRMLGEYNGRKLCKLCCSGDLKLCEKCGNTISAGRGKQCEICYWETLLKNRALNNCALLGDRLLQVAFLDFARWLGLSSGFKKASLVISRHALLFEKVDTAWGHFPDYPELLKVLGADYLRRHSKILEWLQENKGLVIDECLKKDLIEEERIQNLLSGIPRASKAISVISQYETLLRDKLRKGRISVRTLRLLLTPALALMRLCELENNGFPSTKQVKRYLNISPGQKASLTSFITFLRKEYELEVVLPKNIKCTKLRKKFLEKELVILTEKEWGNTELLYWCKYALELFHGLRLSMKSVKELIKNREVYNEGIIINHKCDRVFLPLPKCSGVNQLCQNSSLT